MKKVSIITPVYNTEKYIKGTIESVLNQSYENIEFIIINDGSTDSSDKIISSFKDKRIKYIKQKNGGIGNARNRGLKEVTGDYICFLDSDDQMEENAIEKMVKHLENTKSDMIISGYNEVFENSSEKHKVSFPHIEGNVFENPKLINTITLGPNHKLFKLKLFDNLKFPEKVKYEDFALMLKVMTLSKKVSTCDEYLFNDTKRVQSETRVVDKRIYDMLISLEDVINFYEKLEYPSDKVKASIKEELDYFIVYMCTLYASKEKYQKDKEIKYKFIDDAYAFMKKYVPNYKQNKYFKDQSLIKRTIQKNKLLLKIYCML